MAFDFITEFKKLCVQLQKEDILVYLKQSRDMMEKDQELQGMIGEFNLKKYQLSTEMAKPDADEEKMNQLDVELNKLYDDILANEFMVAFAEASDEVDRLTKHIQAIITATAGGCSGSCSSCSGCH